MDLFDIMFYFGILNLVLVIFQVFTGMRAIKIPTAVHKISGIVLSVTATIHGVIALSFYA
jgi:hypothetical protein